MEFEDINLNGQQAVMTNQGIFMRIIACYEKALKEKKRCLSHQSSVLLIS